MEHADDLREAPWLSILVEMLLLGHLFLFDVSVQGTDSSEELRHPQAKMSILFGKEEGNGARGGYFVCSVRHK